MPRRPDTPCARPGCPAKGTGRFCAEHARQRAQSYDRNRPSSTARGYDRRWRRYRSYFLSQPEHVVCACGCGQVATDVDHIQPVTGPDDPLFWDASNHQALTHACHARKTALEDGGYGRDRGGGGASRG